MRRLLLVVVVVGVFVGCGGAKSGIGTTAARSLEPTIAEVRVAAEARQPDTVTAKLAELRAEVKKLQEQGELDEAGAARVLAAAGEVEDSLMLITTTTAQPRPPMTLRPTTTKQPDRKDQEEKSSEEERKKEEEKKDEEKD